MTLPLASCRPAPWRVALTLSALLASTAAADLETNGSFESGPDPGEMMVLNVGSTVVPGWVVTRAPIEYCGTVWQAAEGARSLALNGSTAGGIAQTLATTPGWEYTVRFFMIGDAFSNPILKHMRVQAAGQFADYEVDAGHAWPWGMGWLEKTFVFTAAGTSTELEFVSLDSGEQGPTLDHVEVTLNPAVGVPGLAAGGLALAAPWPTPAHGALHVGFTLPTPGPVRLSVIDLAGREVAVLDHGLRAAGPHAITWNARTRDGRAPAGIYVIQLDAGGEVRTRKAVVAP